jgi:hypothetical protein
MLKHQLDSWIALAANIGLVIGLVLVAYEINLNTESIRLQTALDLNHGIMEAEVAFMGDSTHVAFTTAILNPEKLSDAQVSQLWAYVNIAMFSTLNAWVSYQAGFATETDWQHAKAVAVKFISFNVGVAYWKGNKNTVFPKDFVHEIDEALTKVDLENTEHVYREMLNDIRSK